MDVKLPTLKKIDNIDLKTHRKKTLTDLANNLISSKKRSALRFEQIGQNLTKMQGPAQIVV